MFKQRTVTKTKSVEYMPFFLSFFLFLNAGVWSTYAVLVKDYYIGVTLCLFSLYLSVCVCEGMTGLVGIQLPYALKLHTKLV